MKLKLKALSFILLLLCARAYAQAPAGQNYTCKTTTVPSATAPVMILAPARITTFSIHNRSNSGVAALVFPYNGNLPVSPPVNAMEIPPGAFWEDAVSCNSPDCEMAIGQGFAAVLYSGTTAITVDTCSR